MKDIHANTHISAPAPKKRRTSPNTDGLANFALALVSGFGGSVIGGYFVGPVGTAVGFVVCFAAVLIPALNPPR